MRQSCLLKMQVFCGDTLLLALRPFDTIEQEEEEEEPVSKQTMEEKMEVREQYINYAGIGLLVFAAIMIIDLFFSVC